MIIEYQPSLMMQNPSSYIGCRGYTIYKSSLSAEDERWIRKKLHVQPFIPGSPFQPTGFDVYRESKRKLYLPKIFGIENFGEPDQIALPEGVEIEVPFAGKLRDYQEPVVNSFLELQSDMKGGVIDLPCGYGKTSCALYIASKLRKKTMVIVHKSFLMTQWEERIRQFLPSAKVGKVQGEVFDIEGKDIVLAMLQSLSMKAYPIQAFTSFGTTIIDECHHIPSEVFSRALNKIVTENILGLSATVERKDGLSSVLRMFVGPTVYSIKRKPETSVQVRQLQYKDSALELELSLNSTDYRGNVKYSSLITKLCSSSERTGLVKDLIVKEMHQHPNKQILVLSHYKQLLADLAELLQQETFEAGYYVGGMKQAALDESAKKNVLLATYAMAAEGLDIPSLTTLVLATPRTDIVQAVGRILRSKHERPLIIDIVDPHPTLQRQWTKRKKYYSQNRYRVMKLDSDSWRAGLPWSACKSKSAIPRPAKCLI